MNKDKFFLNFFFQPNNVDFTCIVKKDLELLEKDDESVKIMSKKELKNIIKESIN